MTVNRLPDYLGHIRQAAADACSFIDGLDKEGFLADKRTQSAVVMSLVVIGEAATKVMDRYPEFVAQYPTRTLRIKPRSAGEFERWAPSRVVSLMRLSAYHFAHESNRFS